MSRSLSKTLIRFSDSLSSSSSMGAVRFANLRHRSGSPEVFSREIPADEVESLAVKNLEDAIHMLIVKRSQPDWIPLVPGASYWVPPRSKSQGFAHVIAKLANDSAGSVIRNKSVSLSSNHCWPSSAYFFKGASHSPLEGEFTPKAKHTSQTEDEEG